MTKIVLEVAEELKGLEAPLRALVAETERRLQDAKQGRRLDYELFEQRLSERLGEVERTVHAATLAALDLDAERVLIDDKLHARVGRNPAEYKTQAGAVSVPRSLYRPLGERNAPTVDLVTLRSGAIADGWLPGTARAWRTCFSRALHARPSRRRSGWGGCRTRARASSASDTRSVSFSLYDASPSRRH